MCDLWVKKAAEDGLQRTQQKIKIEQRLARLSRDDSVAAANGLELMLHSVDDWSLLTDLRSVRKIRLFNRHRVYIRGRHTDCQFAIIHVLPFKTKKDDKPGTKGFQEMIRKALESKGPDRKIMLTESDQNA